MNQTRSVTRGLVAAAWWITCVACSSHGGTDNGAWDPQGDSTDTTMSSTSDPCASHTTCASCAAASGCGFCAGHCYTGTSSGPSAGSCGGSTWAWSTSACTSTTSTTDACSENTTCASCTAQAACGFCNGRCYTGTSSGPSTGSCGGSTWAWHASECSGGAADSGARCTYLGSAGPAMDNCRCGTSRQHLGTGRYSCGYYCARASDCTGIVNPITGRNYTSCQNGSPGFGGICT